MNEFPARRKPYFSLVLATLGRAIEIEQFVDTVAAQLDGDLELLIIDQNVDDRLLPLIARARSLGIDVHHQRQSTPNLSAARNFGLSLASGEVVAFPDDDCWYEPGTLAAARNAFALNDCAGVVGRWFESMPDARLPQSKLSWSRSRTFRDIPTSSITLFIKRSLFDEAGGFDARLGVAQWFGAGEEVDFVLRTLRGGATLTFAPGVVVHHRIGASMRQPWPEMFRSVRSRARGVGALYTKHALPWWVILRGVLAPLLQAIAKGKSVRAWLHAMATTLGRLEGMVAWRLRHGCASK